MFNKIFLGLILFCGLLMALLPQEAEARKKTKEKTHMMAGEASWYGGNFHGKTTASGPIYDMDRPTAAHRTLPFGSVLEVTDTTTGVKTVVIITDRGPVSPKRCVDLSRSAAMELDLGVRGVTPVTMRLVSDVSGNMLDSSEAFYLQVQKKNAGSVEKLGPFTNFADVSVLQDMLKDDHEKATIIVAHVEK